MDIPAIHYEYPTFTIKSDDPNRKLGNALDYMNFQHNPQSKPHCQKCGRRSRSHNKSNNTSTNNRRVKSEQRRCRHGHRLKSKRPQRLFPTEFPPYPIINQTNDNHSMSNNILIDQLIQVQQLDTTTCNTQSHEMDNDYRIFPDTMNKKEKRNRHSDYSQKYDKLQQVQQMIYLRENINNLTYRELHFPYEYILLKRLEEKNHLINQNRCKVDHYFRSLKLQYQTTSTLLQHVPITSFIYSKQDPCQAGLTIKTSLKRCPISEDVEFNLNTFHNKPYLSSVLNQPTTINSNSINPSTSVTDRSFPVAFGGNETMTNESLVKQNGILSTDDPTQETINRSSSSIDPPISPIPYNQYKQPQYSRNATQSHLNTDHLPKNKNKSSIFDTAVIVDVTKCPQYQEKLNTANPHLIHQPPNQDNWNHIRSTWSMPILTNNQQKSSSFFNPNQIIYFNQYPQLADIHPQQTMFNPWPQNSNYIHHQSNFNNIIQQQTCYNPIYNESFSNPYQTTWLSPGFPESNELQFPPANDHPFHTISPNHNKSEKENSNIIQNTSRSSNQKSLSFTNSATTLSTSNTSYEEKSKSVKYTQAINKIKQILNILQKNLLNKSILKTEVINKKINSSFPVTEINKSISTTMTSDSLISNISIETTYSVSSTLPILNRKTNKLPFKSQEQNFSTINLEDDISQMELDSLNNNHHLNRAKSNNCAKNINSNEQMSEEDETRFHLSFLTSSIRKKTLNYTRSKRSISPRITVRYMSPSFMFNLQLLIIICLINRFFVYYFFGIVPSDILSSDNSQSVTPTSSAFVSETIQTTKYMNSEIFNKLFSSFFKLVYSK